MPHYLPAFLYGLPPFRSHSRLNSCSRISAPRFRVSPVSSRLSSHICMSSTPATSRIGGLSACSSIWRATYWPSKCAYHQPRLFASSGLLLGRTNGIRKYRCTDPFVRSCFWGSRGGARAAVNKRKSSIKTTPPFDNPPRKARRRKIRTSFHDAARRPLVLVHRGALAVLCLPRVVHLEAAVELVPARLQQLNVAAGVDGVAQLRVLPLAEVVLLLLDQLLLGADRFRSDNGLKRVDYNLEDKYQTGKGAGLRVIASRCHAGCGGVREEIAGSNDYGEATSV